MTDASRRGILYLVPTSLGGTDAAALLPAATQRALMRVQHFIVENPRSARAFLKAVGFSQPIQTVHMSTLDEHTPATDLEGLLEPLMRGCDCAILAEAGCPGIADPGAALVALAHAHGIKVSPLVGPSAILLAVMASGMNGQRFTFHGYLPVEQQARTRTLKGLERDSERSGATQIFIETPYRNAALFDAIVASCQADTRICIACDLTLPTEFVVTRRVGEWARSKPQLERRPAVFLLLRHRAAAQKR